MRNNVLDYLNEIVKEKPHKTAYSDGTVSLSFLEVYGQSRSIASFLHKKGIYRKPVVIFMKKSPLEVAAFFGAVAAGNFYVPIDEEMPAGRIQLILDNVQSPLVICDESTFETAKSFRLGAGEAVLFGEAVSGEINED